MELLLVLFSYLNISRNTKKAEDNVKSLESEIEENIANIQKLEVYHLLKLGLKAT